MITLHTLSNLVLVPTRERNLDLDIINKPIDVNHQNSRQIPLFFANLLRKMIQAKSYGRNHPI